MSESQEFQLVVTTSDEQKNYFTGEPQEKQSEAQLPSLPDGRYRVVAGALVRLVPGRPEIPPPNPSS